MRIIQTTNSLAPEFGGPARSVPALSVEIARMGLKVTVLSPHFDGETQRFDLPTHPNLSYERVSVSLGLGMRPLFISDYHHVLSLLVGDGQDLLIHDNGIWLPYGRTIHKIARERGVPVITSTRGMLEPWTFKYGRFRKLLAWYIYQKRRLEQSAVLHATSKDEVRNLRNLGLKSPITLIPNGTILPDLAALPAQVDSGKKTLLFLSRIHPKKGLLNLVRALKVLQPNGWKVILAGYNEGEHWDKVRKEILKSGLEDVIEYIGPLSDHEKWSWYRLADLFILPSYSENFGLVIAEALAAETPVITTQGTPWKDLIDYNCGWWIKPEVPDLVQALGEAFSMDRNQLNEMGMKGRKLVEDKYSWPSIAKRLIEVYQWALGIGPEPDDILL